MFLLRSSDLKLLLVFLFGIGVILMEACGEGEVEEKTTKQTLPPGTRRAQEWADAQLAQMSLPEKVGQLILAEGPTTSDTNVVRAFAQVLDEYHIGGMLLRPMDRWRQASIAGECQKGTRLPLWIGMEADDQWAELNGYAHLLSLGATRVDTLARDWGRAIGAECANLGAQLCFTSAVRVSPPGQPLENSLGASIPSVTSMARSMLEGIRAEGALPCLRTLPMPSEFSADSAKSLPELVGSPKGIWSEYLRPADVALKAHLGVPQLSHLLLPGVDTLPLTLSAKAIRSLLRYGMDYKGLVFSPSFSDTLPGNQYPAGMAERLALQAGVDVIVAPRDPVAVIDEVLRAVEVGLMSEADLDIPVRKVLLQKAFAGMDTLVLLPADSVRLARNAIALKSADYRISEHAVTLIWDTENRLPLRKSVEQKKIATLALGSRETTPMQKMMAAYAPMDHFMLPFAPAQSKLDALAKRFDKYDLVLVELHGQQEIPGDTMSQRVQAFLYQLEYQNQLVVTNFGQLSWLEQLDSLSCVLAVYDEREVSQQIAGQYIFGGIAAGGKLPIDVCGRYCAGEGSPSPKKIRLEYVDPEVLGVDPHALLRVDSILNAAIWMGTFPGCQVLAAKDGKVFLHKAYGHHDYTGTRRVRLSDVYDIASITKIAATTLMAMRAYEQGKLNLSDPISSYLKELDSSHVTVKDITPRELMIHQAGLPPGLGKLVYRYYTMMDSVDSLRSQYYSTRKDDSVFTVQVADRLYFNETYLDTIWNKVRFIKLDTSQGYKYSDVSMFLMKAVLERIYGKDLDTFVRNAFYTPLGLQTMGYMPLRRFDKEEVVPTENDHWWRKQVLRGHVHDHSTALFGGVGGQAGLFTNARDLATILQMLLNGGEYGGRRYFKPSTVRKFTTRQPGSHRGLGFDMQRPVPVEGKGYCCMNASPNTFGHFGFTGTCAWADPDNEVVYILLTNRVFPKARNPKINAFRVRQAVQKAIYDALGLGEMYCVPLLFAEKMDSTSVDARSIAVEGMR